MAGILPQPENCGDPSPPPRPLVHFCSAVYTPFLPFRGSMDEQEKGLREKKQTDPRRPAHLPEAKEEHGLGTAEDILSKRLQNLAEAIAEIDRGLEEHPCSAQSMPRGSGRGFNATLCQ